MAALYCPKGHGAMVLKLVSKGMALKGVVIAVDAEVFVCPRCGLEAGTLQTAGAMQLAIVDAYRAKQGFLTSNGGNSGDILT